MKYANHEQIRTNALRVLVLVCVTLGSLTVGCGPNWRWNNATLWIHEIESPTWELRFYVTEGSRYDANKGWSPDDAFMYGVSLQETDTLNNARLDFQVERVEIQTDSNSAPQSLSQYRESIGPGLYMDAPLWRHGKEFGPFVIEKPRPERIIVTGNIFGIQASSDFHMGVENLDMAEGRHPKETVSGPSLTAFHTFQKKTFFIFIITFLENGHRGIRICQHPRCHRNNIGVFGKFNKGLFIRQLI